MDTLPPAASVHSEVSAVEACIIEASNDYGISPFVLRAIYEVEGGKLGRKSKNSNGTYDHGPMQINTIWLKKLKKYRIGKNELTNNACVNVYVAAWILDKEIRGAGGDIWKGVGNYHSKTPKYHNRYLRKVYAAYKKYVNKWLSYYRGQKSSHLAQVVSPGSSMKVIRP